MLQISQAPDDRGITDMHAPSMCSGGKSDSLQQAGRLVMFTSVAKHLIPAKNLSGHLAGNLYCMAPGLSLEQ